jgi:regulator of protease activity HflC (stomatin/prohibitin superfamily)
MNPVYALLGVILALALAAYALKKSVIVVQEETAVVIERFGRFHRLLSSGLNFVVPLVDRRKVIVWTGGKPKVRYGLRIDYLDLREQIVYADPRPIITRDNVTLVINPIVYWRILDVRKAVYEIGDLIDAIITTTISALRNATGELELDETLVSRERINQKVLATLTDIAPRWGIEVSRVEMVEIEPPSDIRAAMEKQMRAERERRARILEAEGLKQAEILQAEGEKEAAIRRAEGEKEAAIRHAEGQKEAAIRRAEADEQVTLMQARAKKQAAILVGEGQAQVAETVYAALHRAAPSREILALKYMEMLTAMADGESNKVYIPYDGSGLTGLLTQFKELWADN